jgi:ribosome maturation factor RimP
MPLNEDISAAIRPIIEASGNYLEELTITSAGKVKILTVIVDSDSHLNLDQITAVTKEISEVIETLTKPRHWRKNFDRLVKITMTSGQDIQGRIGEATETTVLVGDQTVSFEDIKRAVLEIEFK